MNTLTIQDVLRSVETGRMQSVGLMQVIPLISELVDDRFVSPAEARMRTIHYPKVGMEFANGSDNLLLVPAQTGYVVKMPAQDFALPHAAVVKPNQVQNYHTAMCIQQTQPGEIPQGNYDFLILPYALRERALQLRGKVELNKLWTAIGKFNQGFGLQNVGNLVRLSLIHI